MSFFGWPTLAFFHSQSVVSLMSFVDPPVKLSSAWLSTSSVTNLVASAFDVPPNTWSQSSPGAAWCTALPSSSKRPSLCTARAAGASANVAYCSSSDRMNRALHDRATPRRTRELASPRAPRDNIDMTSLMPPAADPACPRSPDRGVIPETSNPCDRIGSGIGGPQPTRWRRVLPRGGRKVLVRTPYYYPVPGRCQRTYERGVPRQGTPRPGLGDPRIGFDGDHHRPVG